MLLIKSGCCGCSLRTNLLVVLYINAIVNGIGFICCLAFISDHQQYGYSTQTFIATVICYLLNMLFSIVPIVKAPETSLGWLKGFIYVKVLETIITVISIIEVNPLNTFKTGYDSGVEASLSEYNYLNDDQRNEMRQRAQEIYEKIEFLAYAAIVVQGLIFLVYFPFVVYSYLVAIKRQDATNAYSSPVGKKFVAPRNGFIISAPPDACNPYMTTFPNVPSKV